MVDDKFSNLGIVNCRLSVVGYRLRLVFTLNFRHLNPGPDLAWQDAVMQSEAFIISENSCIPTSRRARAGWHARTEFNSSCLGLLRRH